MFGSIYCLTTYLGVVVAWLSGSTLVSNNVVTLYV